MTKVIEKTNVGADQLVDVVQLTDAIEDIDLQLFENSETLLQLEVLSQKLEPGEKNEMIRHALVNKKKLMDKKEALENLINVMELRDKYNNAISQLDEDEYQLAEDVIGKPIGRMITDDGAEILVNDETEPIPEEDVAKSVDSGTDHRSDIAATIEVTAETVQLGKLDFKDLTDELFQGRPAFRIRSEYSKKYAGLANNELFIISGLKIDLLGDMRLKEGDEVVALKRGGAWHLSKAKKEALIGVEQAKTEFGVKKVGSFRYYAQMSGSPFEPQGEVYKWLDESKSHNISGRLFVVEEGHKHYDVLKTFLNPKEYHVIVASYDHFGGRVPCWIFSNARRDQLKLMDGSDSYDEDQVNGAATVESQVDEDGISEISEPESSDTSDKKGADVIDANAVLAENGVDEPLADIEVYRDPNGKLRSRKKNKPVVIQPDQIEKFIQPEDELFVIGHDFLTDYPGLAGQNLYIFEGNENNQKEYDLLAESLRLNYGETKGEVIVIVKKENGASFAVIKRDALVDTETFEIEELYIEDQEEEAAKQRVLVEAELGVSKAKPDEAAEPVEAISIIEDDGDGFSLFSASETDSLLPELPQISEAVTIADLKYRGEALVPHVQEALDSLERTVPEVGFDGLTPDEVITISQFLEEKSEMDNSELWKELVDFANQIVMASYSYMEGRIPDKMVRLAKEVVKRDRSGKEYKPTRNSLETLAAATILVCENLLSRNLDQSLLDDKYSIKRSIDKIGDHSELDVHHLNPLVALALRKIQDVVTQRTMILQAKELSRAYTDMISFHSEMILKLDAANKKLQEFFKDDGHREIVSCVSFLRRLIGYWNAYGRLTPKQQEVGLEVYQQYRQTVQFMLNSTPELVEVITSRLERRKGDPLMAQRELLLCTDDSARKTTGYEMAVSNQDKQFMAINRILKELDLNRYHEGVIKLNKHNFLKYPHSLAALKRYFEMTDEDRKQLKKQFQEDDDHKMRKAAEMFFNIMDQYLEDENPKELKALNS